MNYSSDSDYNMSDSQGFNDFMNESEDSSSGYIPMPKTNARPGRQNAADPYAYDFDFGNIKAPTKEDLKKKPAASNKKPASNAKKPGQGKNLFEASSSSESRPKAKPAAKGKKPNLFDPSSSSESLPKPKQGKKPVSGLNKILHKGGNSSESEEDSEESSEFNHKKFKRDYLDSSSNLTESNDTYNIKTEPFVAKANQPISLKKKFDVEPVKEVKNLGKNEKGFFKQKEKIGNFSPLSSDIMNSSEIGSEFKRESNEESELYSQDSNAKYTKTSAYQPSSRSDQVSSNSLAQSGIEKKEDKHLEKFSENFSIRPQDKKLEIKGKNQETDESQIEEGSYDQSEGYSDEDSQQGSNLYTDSQKYTENYTESQSEALESQSNRIKSNTSHKYTENQSDIYSEKFDEYESQQLADSHPALPKVADPRVPASKKVGETIFRINEVENEDESRVVRTPQLDQFKPMARPQTTNDYLKTRERELEIELVDLRRLVANLESELDSKQQQLFYYEKREKQANFAKVEYEALEKAKTQLREAYHKIELYKIETEELIKQVDFNEARAKDLQVENNLLKAEMEKKEKGAEERLKMTESRTSERLVKELTRQFELEKEDFLRRKNEMEIDMNRIKADYAKLEGENRELRTKVFSFRENEEKVKDLEHQIFTLTNKEPAERSEAVKESPNEELRKELIMQDQLIAGFQRENEKLTQEIRRLKAQIKDEQLKIHHETKKIDLLKSNLIRDHGGVLIKENISDLASINELAGGTVINKEEYLALKENVARLSRELMEKERSFREKELEYCEHIENLRKVKFESEYLITSMQRSQVFTNENQVEEKYEQEKKQLVESYEREILILNDKLAILSQNRPESTRVKVLEDHIRSLEEALRQKEPISTLIKAVKPDSSDEVNFLSRKVSELEEKLKEKNSKPANKKPGKNITKTHPKAADGGLIEKIKELEKQLEEKNYYISKLSSIKPDSTEELRHLREQVSNYERVIKNMEKQKNPLALDLFPFLSSYSGTVWTQICQEVAALKGHINQKNSKELIQISSKLIELLESTSASPEFANLNAFDRILDKTLAMFSLLKGVPNWQAIEKVHGELAWIIGDELNLACNGGPEPESDREEEYWSDFSDNDQEQEEVENNESLDVINKIKNGIGYLNRIGGGWLALSQVQEILSANIPELNNISLRNMLRRVSGPGGKINIDNFLREVRENSLKQWQEKLRTILWEQKEKVSSRGNHSSIVDRSLVPWIVEGILEKIENYVEKEGIDFDMLTEQIFSGSISLSKRNFRVKALEHKLPLTREECLVLVKELDKGKSGQISAKVFLGFIKRVPKQAWQPKPTESFPEYKQLSERDSNFLLLQANKRISELEGHLKQGSGGRVNLNSDYTLSLKLKTIEEELEAHKSKLSFVYAENEKLKADKARLENHVNKQQISVGASEYLALQRKIEIIEENHYRREQELRNMMSGMSYKSDQEMIEIRKKFDSEKNLMQKVIMKKNLEIQEFKAELEELLKQIEILRAKRKTVR